jgi:dTDP-glucose 4,6-dehydratase
MNILVTGGCGFIGSNFIHQIITDNRIWNIDKLGIGSNPKNLDKIKSNSNYTFIKGDISKQKIPENIFETLDVVVNFAAETHVDRSIENPQPFINNNYIGAFNLLEQLRKTEHKARYIQVSTDEVYGDIIEGSHTEKSTLNPSNPYSASKAAADLLCKAYHRTYGLDTIVTRCTNNYGPRQYPEKLVPKTIMRAQKDMKIPIYGTGENIRDWLYVLDHCSAIQYVIKQGEPGEIYNISANQEASVNQIVTTILEYMKKPLSLMEKVEDRPGHDIRYSLDSSKLKGLGWEPLYMLIESLYLTIDWYLQNPWIFG